LTLLFLCDQVEAHPLFISAFSAAGFQLLVMQHTEEAKTLLSHISVDAVAVWDNGIRDHSPLGGDLKVVAGRTPIILFSDANNHQPTPHGIDSVCRVDTKDEILLHAAAIFFRQSLTASRSRELMKMPENRMRRFVPGAGTRVAV